MTERAKPRNPKQRKPAPKPSADIAERDLDKVSGGVSATPRETLNPPATPPGVPIPYPNKA